MTPTLGSRLVAGTMLAALASFPALAQNAPNVAAVPPTREEIQRAAPPPPTQQPSRLTVEGGIERAPCPLAEPRFAGVTINLADVQFDNLRVVSKEVLRPAFADFLGKTVPIAAVCEIRDAAATILRREGYIAAVQVPPQRIADGVVHFDVLMAKLVSVQVRGDAGKSERLIASYLDHLKGAEAFNEKEAERYLLLARDLPGFDVRLTLRPAGTVPGEVIGEVTVVKIPFAIDANIQNYGSRSVGRFGGLIRGEAYDLLGLGDRLTLGYFSTADLKEQNVVQGGYEFRVGGEGLTVGSRFTYAWTHPDIGGGLKLISHTLVASGELSYPFIRHQATNLRGAAGIDYIDQNVAFGGTGLTRDHLRVAFARAEFEAIDHASLRSTIGYSVSEPKWRLAGTLEVRQGVDIFDATRRCDAVCLLTLPTPSRAEADPTAFVVRFSGEAVYRPVPNLTFALTPSAQYAPHALLSYEEYSGGNYTIGRGYDPGAIIGDSGVGAQAEIRFGSIVPKKQDAFAFQPYAFVDAAWVWNRDSVTFQGHNPQHLLSVGGGVRAAYGDHGRLDLTVAAPLERPYLAQRRGDVRVLLSLTTRLLPW